jgi:hypothetical protein
MTEILPKIGFVEPQNIPESVKTTEWGFRKAYPSVAKNSIRGTMYGITIRITSRSLTDTSCLRGVEFESKTALNHS